MKTRVFYPMMILGLCAICASGQDSTGSMAAPEQSKIVALIYPNLASGALTRARPGELPEGVLVRAGETQITQADLDAEISRAPESVREQLRRNAFFLTEQMVTRLLLLREAKAAANGKTGPTMSDQEALDAYLEKLAADIEVSDTEVAQFYESNKDMVGGQELAQVRHAIASFLRQQKQRQIIDRHIRTFGDRLDIQVASAWIAHQAALAQDNPVDKARSSGRPSLVDFGSKGCRPCDMLSPILDTLKTKYESKANIVFVSVREHQVLAARYGIQSIPEQIFFDKDGREVFRHTGFWSQAELEKKLAEMGVN